MYLVVIDLYREDKRDIQCFCCFAANIQEISHPVMYEALISNPPYIPERDMEELADEVVRYSCKCTLNVKSILSPLQYIATNIQEVSHPVMYEALISNPPYIPERDMEELADEVVRYCCKCTLNIKSILSPLQYIATRKTGCERKKLYFQSCHCVLK